MSSLCYQTETNDETRGRVLTIFREAGMNPAIVPLIDPNQEKTVNQRSFAAHTEIGTIGIYFTSDEIKIDWSDAFGVRQRGEILNKRIRRSGYTTTGHQTEVKGYDDLRRCLSTIRETLS